MTPAEKIRTARKGRRLAQHRLAELVGCTQQAISAWEEGLRVPRPRYARRLELALNIDLDPTNGDGRRTRNATAA